MPLSSVEEEPPADAWERIEYFLARAWERFTSSSLRLEEEALHIGVALWPNSGLHAIWQQKQGSVWSRVAAGYVRCETGDYEAKLVGPGLRLPVIHLLAAYVQPLQGSGWCMVRYEIAPLTATRPALLQKITAPDVYKLLDDPKLGSPRLPLEELAWAIECIRREAVVATVIERTIKPCRAYHARVDDAKATLRRHLRSVIERATGEGNESDLVRARASLASLDQVPGTAPLPRLELARHHAAVELAGAFTRAFGADAARWYRAGPAIRFVARGLDMIGLPPSEPGAIEGVIRRPLRV